MDMYPLNYDRSDKRSLQSRLFGHRIKTNQTKYEYLIEFLQVAIARKEDIQTGKRYMCMFPVENNGMENVIRYYPEARMGLKRFIFMPKSKLDGKAQVDKAAYEECVKVLESNIKGGTEASKKTSVSIIQNLLGGFTAVNQNRSWFDQNLLPICPEVILPEGMGKKSKRKNLVFAIDSPEVDNDFEFNMYTYMCRGGEVYYLHLLNAINQYPSYAANIEHQLRKAIGSFPQFSYLCNFVQNSWENYMLIEDRKTVKKELSEIPRSFSVRNEYTLNELNNFLSSKSHPFEKLEILSNGLILQLLRMMYVASSTEGNSNCWIVDVNCKGYESIEVKKAAIAGFRRNEEIICKYLYSGLEKLRDELKIVDDNKAIKDAADDSYRLFRKLGKAIGIVIPNSGPGMRFSVSEEVIKFLVLSIIPAQKMITLDEFIELLYKHFGMVIGPEQYRKEMENGSVRSIGDLSAFELNKAAFAQKLKDCGFLRDLSDATSIVENPYESEECV